MSEFYTECPNLGHTVLLTVKAKERRNRSTSNKVTTNHNFLMVMTDTSGPGVTEHLLAPVHPFIALHSTFNLSTQIGNY